MSFVDAHAESGKLGNLTPVSTNARHQPIRVPIADLDDGIGISIVALVVSKTTRLF